MYLLTKGRSILINKTYIFYCFVSSWLQYVYMLMRDMTVTDNDVQYCDHSEWGVPLELLDM